MFVCVYLCVFRLVLELTNKYSQNLCSLDFIINLILSVGIPYI